MQTTLSTLIRCPLERGINDYYGLPDRRLQHLSFGIAHLQDGDRFGETLNKREGILVLLDGKVLLKGDKYDHGEVAVDPPDQVPPTATYCPPGLFTMKAREPARVAIFRRECGTLSKKTDSQMISAVGATPSNTPANGIACHRVYENSESGFTVGCTHCSEAEDRALGPGDIFREFASSPKQEGLLFFRLPQKESPAPTIRVQRPDGEETHSLQDLDLVILPADTTFQLQATAPLTCLWMTGRLDG
jgi:hypothetical protein